MKIFDEDLIYLGSSQGTIITIITIITINFVVFIVYNLKNFIHVSSCQI